MISKLTSISQIFSWAREVKEMFEELKKEIESLKSKKKSTVKTVEQGDK